jgi:amino acid permease
MRKLWGRTLGLVYEISIIISCIGSMLAYLLLVGDACALIMINFKIAEDFELTKTIVMISSSLVFILPLSMLKNLSGLKIAAVTSAGTVLYLTVLVIYQFPYFYFDHYLLDLTLFNIDENVFSSYCLCLFAQL